MTVLIADDMAMIRRPLATFLERRGHTVIQAEDGDEALEVLAREKIDALVIDISMPMKDGLATLEALAQKGTLPPTLVVTGQTDPATVEKAMSLGAKEVVRKATMALKEIAAKVEALLA